MINYYLLTKPGIIMGNLITLSAGFLLASQGEVYFSLFFLTLLGLSLVMASACAFNNYIDRGLDKKMERTKNRALAVGAISLQRALLFATMLGIIGAVVLFAYTNLLTLFIALIGFFVYVVLYSMWKARTIYGTAIGSIAGSVPPIVGYCAVSNRLDLGALLLFLLLVFWQMPHFFSIALNRLDDYIAASVPVLPVLKGSRRTKIHMLFYIVCFTLIAVLLTAFHYTGKLFLIIALLLGSSWLVLCLKGLRRDTDPLWAKKMFRLSLVVITILSSIIWI
ncbi:MAG: heme o synthase [Chlamydiales bacterium]